MRERQCAGFVIRSVQLRFKRATSTAGQDGNRDRAQRSPSEPLETGYPAIAEHTQRLAQRFFLFYSPVCGRQPTANRAKSQLPACAPLDAGWLSKALFLCAIKRCSPASGWLSSQFNSQIEQVDNSASLKTFHLSFPLSFCWNLSKPIEICGNLSKTCRKVSHHWLIFTSPDRPESRAARNSDRKQPFVHKITFLRESTPVAAGLLPAAIERSLAKNSFGSAKISSFIFWLVVRIGKLKKLCKLRISKCEKFFEN